MRMPRSILLVITFVGGGIVGYLAANWSKKERDLADAARSAGAAIVHDSNVLNAIEKGETTNAVMVLRSSIILQTMILEGSLRELPPSRRHTNLVRILEQIKK